MVDHFIALSRDQQLSLNLELVDLRMIAINLVDPCRRWKLNLWDMYTQQISSSTNILTVRIEDFSKTVKINLFFGIPYFALCIFVVYVNSCWDFNYTSSRLLVVTQLCTPVGLKSTASKWAQLRLDQFRIFACSSHLRGNNCQVLWWWGASRFGISMLTTLSDSYLYCFHMVCTGIN